MQGVAHGRLTQFGPVLHLVRQRPTLDWRLIVEELQPLLELRETPDNLEKLHKNETGGIEQHEIAVCQRLRKIAE